MRINLDIYYSSEQKAELLKMAEGNPEFINDLEEIINEDCSLNFTNKKPVIILINHIDWREPEEK